MTLTRILTIECQKRILGIGEKMKRKKKIETKSPQYYNTNQLLHQGSIPKDNTANVLL